MASLTSCTLNRLAPLFSAIVLIIDVPFKA